MMMIIKQSTHLPHSRPRYCATLLLSTIHLKTAASMPSSSPPSTKLLMTKIAFRGPFQ